MTDKLYTYNTDIPTYCSNCGSYTHMESDCEFSIEAWNDELRDPCDDPRSENIRLNMMPYRV